MEIKLLGVLRNVDDIGRVLIPKEIRDRLKLKKGSVLEFLLTEKGDVVIRKFDKHNKELF